MTNKALVERALHVLADRKVMGGYNINHHGRNCTTRHFHWEDEQIAWCGQALLVCEDNEASADYGSDGQSPLRIRKAGRGHKCTCGVCLTCLKILRKRSGRLTPTVGAS